MSGPQEIILVVFAGILGLFVGSFLNVCIFRLPRNCMSVLRPLRSCCPACRAAIPWYDNLPVVSWLSLGGKCRSCGGTISPRYALVELLTGVLFFYAAWRLLSGPGEPGAREAFLFALHAWFLGALVVCTFIDLEFQILPDEVTIPGILIGVGASALLPGAHLGPRPESFGMLHPYLEGFACASVGAIAGGGAIYFVGVIGKLAFRKEAMGFGDVKFMAMVGALLGWSGALLTFLVACFLGAFFGVGKFIVMRRMGYVAFGPFLVAGALVLFFWSPLVMSVIDAYLNMIRPDPLP